MNEAKLTQTQRDALAKIRAKGKWFAGNGISRTTVRALQRAGLVTVEWTTHTWTNYRSHRTHHQLDWTARPVAQPQELAWTGWWTRKAAGHYVSVGSDGTTVLAEITREPATLAGGMVGPDRWTLYVYPMGHTGAWQGELRDSRTLRDAQRLAGIRYARELEYASLTA